MEEGSGMSAAAKSCFEPDLKTIVELAKDDSESLMKINKIFTSSLASI